MMYKLPLQYIKCPKTRRKGSNLDAICNNLLVIGGEYTYCYHCCQFFIVEYRSDNVIKLVEINKKEILFNSLICEYEKIPIASRVQNKFDIIA